MFSYRFPKSKALLFKKGSILSKPLHSRWITLYILDSIEIVKFCFERIKKEIIYSKIIREY
jgi:hypothetical protein